MIANLEITYGKETFEDGFLDKTWFDYSGDITKETKEFYDGNEIIAAIATYVDLPIILDLGWAGEKEDKERERINAETRKMYQEIIDNCYIDDENSSIIRTCIFVGKNQDSYTGQFKYRRQGATPAVPAYYLDMQISLYEIERKHQEAEVFNRLAITKK